MDHRVNRYRYNLSVVNEVRSVCPNQLGEFDDLSFTLTILLASCHFLAGLFTCLMLQPKRTPGNNCDDRNRGWTTFLQEPPDSEICNQQ